MKKKYEISQILVGKVMEIMPYGEISPEIETANVYNIVCRRKCKKLTNIFGKKEEYVEIFTEGIVFLDKDESEGECVFRYFDIPYFTPEIDISNYLTEAEKTEGYISKFRILEIYNKINFQN